LCTQVSPHSRPPPVHTPPRLPSLPPSRQPGAHRLPSLPPIQAARCADLDTLSAGSKGLFATPRGCCLPFGSMDLAIAAADTSTAREFEVQSPGAGRSSWAPRLRYIRGASLSSPCTPISLMIPDRTPCHVELRSAPFPSPRPSSRRRCSPTWSGQTSRPPHLTFIPQTLLSDLERADLTGDALDEACDRIQALVKKLELPGKLTEQVRGSATRISDRERYGHGSDGTDPRLCSCP